MIFEIFFLRKRAYKMSPTIAVPKEIEESKNNGKGVRSDAESIPTLGKILTFRPRQATGEGDFGEAQGEILIGKIQYGMHPKDELQPDKSSDIFLRLMREYFVTPIMNSLQSVEPYAETSDAALYINDILHNIQELEKNSPFDPFLEILSGLYIALSYDNKWADYKGSQYAGLRKILKKFANRSSLQNSEIEKAIMAMEEIGFDTTPIPISD